jgi:hypothetical protein
MKLSDRIIERVEQCGYEPVVLFDTSDPASVNTSATKYDVIEEAEVEIRAAAEKRG